MGYTTAKTGADDKMRYTAMYRDITGKPRSAGTFDTEREALNAATIAESDRRRGRGIDERRSRQRLRDYFEQSWRLHHVMEASTHEGYVYLFYRYIDPTFGAMRLRDITTDRVRKWVTALSAVEKASPSTVRNTKVIFDAVMTTLVTDRVIGDHPGRGIKTPPVPRRPRRIVSVEQYEIFRAGLEDHRMRTMVEFDVETGLRWGELTELRPVDLDLSTGVVTVARVVIQLKAAPRPGDQTTAQTSGDGEDARVRFVVKEYPKDKEWRQVKLSEAMRVAISEYITRYRIGKDDLLFPLPEVTGPARRKRPVVLPDPLTLGFTVRMTSPFGSTSLV